jgi:serine/threonine protein phosphatase 1
LRNPQGRAEGAAAVFWKSILGQPKRRPERRFRTGPNDRIYAIGDVHGRVDLLRNVLEAVDSDIRHHPDRRCITVLLGDYIDRGPDSKGVIEMLAARMQSRPTACLMGNHELMLLRFLQDPESWDAWSASGGIPTIISYGIRPPQWPTSDQKLELARALASALPQHHYTFLVNLPFVFESGDILCVHAGLKPGVPVERQQPEDLTWIREEFLAYRGDFGRFIVHGHTPVEEPDIRCNRINIDTGAYATGRLSCVILENEKLTLL